MSKRISSKYDGIFYRESFTNSKSDKTYYISYKENGKSKEKKIGKYSEGIRVDYCKAIRDKAINDIRLGNDNTILKESKRTKVVTLNDIANRYFDDKALYNKSNKKIEQSYIKSIKPIIGKIDINSISIVELEKVQKELASKLAPKTVNWYIHIIKSIYNNAISKDIFSGKNPCVKVKELKVDNSRDRFLSHDEVKQLLDMISVDEVLSLFCNISLCTGGRLETILNITKKDINLGDNTINLKDLKNESSYRGFINDKTKELLKKHIKELKANEYIFSKSEIKYPTRTIQRKLKPMLDELFNQGLDSKDIKNRVVIHTLRHTFASLLAIKGTPILTIQKLLNHKDINMTLRYAKLAPDNGKDEVIKLY